MDYKHYSYKGYYIVEKVDEFDATTMENHNARIEDARKHWDFKKGGNNGFKNIEEVIDYLSMMFPQLSDEPFKELD